MDARPSGARPINGDPCRIGEQLAESLVRARCRSPFRRRLVAHRRRRQCRRPRIEPPGVRDGDRFGGHRRRIDPVGDLDSPSDPAGSGGPGAARTDGRWRLEEARPVDPASHARRGAPGGCAAPCGRNHRHRRSTATSSEADHEVASFSDLGPGIGGAAPSTDVERDADAGDTRRRELDEAPRDRRTMYRRSESTKPAADDEAAEPDDEADERAVRRGRRGAGRHERQRAGGSVTRRGAELAGEADDEPVDEAPEEP